MKRLLLLLCSSLLACPLSAEDALVAASYPGADRVDAKHLQVGSLEFGGSPAQQAYFLVRDELESVIEFYSQEGIEPGKPKRSRLSGVAADLYFAKGRDQSESIKRLEDLTRAASRFNQMTAPHIERMGCTPRGRLGQRRFLTVHEPERTARWRIQPNPGQLSASQGSRFSPCPRRLFLLESGVMGFVLLIRKGNQIRIGIEAPPEMQVHREEIYQRILKERVDGAGAPTDDH